MDLVTFGEAMVRLTPPGFQRLEQAHSLDVHVGGSELNVAVLAARLGVASRWVSRLPDNALGRMIGARAREQGVDAQVEWTADARAGLYFVELDAGSRARNVLYDRAASAISKVTPGSIDWASVFAGTRWYHVSGITPALSEGAAQVTAESLALAKRAGLTVSYDLNYRSKLWTAKQARAVQDPRAPAADPAPHAAIALADGKMHSAPRYDVQVVDRIGAGDAFSGGLIVSRLENRAWDDAVRFAAATAALKHGIPGDFCLVTRDQVDQYVRDATMRVSR